MAIKRKLFHKHEKGMGNEYWFYLAKDTDTGDVFIEREFSVRSGNGYSDGSERLSLEDFLAAKGTRHDKLLGLIGTLLDD